MSREKVEQLNVLGKLANFCATDYSPGDGITRYRFYEGISPRDYFAFESGQYTALGWKEALTYARGRVDGARQFLETLQTIAGIESKVTAYDKHDMAGAIVLAKRVIGNIEVKEGEI